MVHVYYGVVDKIKSAFMFTLSYDDFLEKWVTYTFRMFAKKKIQLNTLWPLFMCMDISQICNHRLVWLKGHLDMF